MAEAPREHYVYYYWLGVIIHKQRVTYSTNHQRGCVMWRLCDMFYCAGNTLHKSGVKIFF